MVIAAKMLRFSSFNGARRSCGLPFNQEMEQRSCPRAVPQVVPLWSGMILWATRRACFDLLSNHVRSEFLHFNIFFKYFLYLLYFFKKTDHLQCCVVLSFLFLFVYFFFTVKDHVPLNEHRRNKRKAKRAARLQQRAADTMETDEDRLNSALVRCFLFNFLRYFFWIKVVRPWRYSHDQSLWLKFM